MKKRLLSAFMCLCMMLTMVPAAFAADADGDNPTMTADVPKEFTVGAPTEFSFTTHGTYNGGNVNGYSNFSDTSAFSSLQYWDGSTWQNFPTGEDFGGGSGFPFADNATSKFQITFTKPGKYTFEAYMQNASTNAQVCSTGEISFIVNAADPVAEFDGVKYATLADAVDAVLDSESKTGTVTLLEDAEGAGIGLFNADGDTSVDLTIDFDGNTYTCTGPAVGSQGTETQMFHLEKGNTVTLKNGTLKDTTDQVNMMIQNYCTLNLEDITICGDSNDTYLVSSNYGDITMKNVNISGTASDLTAIDLMHWLGTTYADKAPTMTIDNTSDDVISGKIDVYCYGNGADSCTDKPTLIITGGTYSTDVSTYVAPNYECVKDSSGDTYSVKKIEDKLVVDTTTEDNNVSGTLEGTFAGGDTDDSGDGVDAGESGVTVDLTTSTSPSSTTSATLNITADTAKSLAEGGATLTVKSDVGTVSLPQSAVAKMEGVENPVTVSITKNDANDDFKASYTVEVKAGDTNLLPEGATDSGTITITVDKPEGIINDLQAWYAVNDGDSLVYVEKLNTQDTETGKIAVSIGHLSTIVLTDGAPTSNEVATVTGQDGIVTGHFSNLSAAITNAAAGSTVTLKGNAKLTTGIDVAKKLTLDLNGYTITSGESWTGDDYLIGVKRDGDLTIQDKTGKGAIATENTSIYCAVKMTVKGEDATGNDAVLTVNGGTLQGYYYGISGNGTRHGTKVTINGGTITASIKDGTAIYQPQDGELIINGGTIKSENTAIEIRSGSLTVTGGTIAGGKGEANVTGNGSGTTTSNTGIAIAQHSTKKPINVSITGGEISGGAAVYESNPQNNTDFTDSPVSVSMENVTLNGAVKSAGFGNMTLDTVKVEGDVSKENNTTGELVILNSTITGTLSTGESNTVTIVNTTVNSQTVPDLITSGAVAAVSGKGTFTSLQAAVDAAPNGATVILLSDVTLDGTDKKNNDGLLTISDKTITLDGNGKTITAKNIAEGATPSMINVVSGADVTVRNLTVDSTGAKHGLNVYSATASVEGNVTIENGSGYAIVANGSAVTVDGLATENNGWGGINVDSKSGAASLTIKNATIKEENSVKIENSASETNADPTVKIEGGNFQYITKGGEIGKPNLTISGGKFATGDVGDAVNVKDYLAPGLSIDSNGNVYKPSSSGGGGGGGGSSSSYVVSVSSASNGSVSVSPKNASKGKTVTITVKPDAGYELDKLTVTDKNGDEISVKRESDTKYTFTMPSGKVTVKATFAKVGEQPQPGISFNDVSTGAYYYDAVLWAVENGVTNGTSATTFSPDMTCTRAQMVTFLWRANGSPKAAGANPFTDVQAGSYYYDAVLWAVEKGITSGTSATTFSPDMTVTRAQTVTFLHRANGSPAISGNSPFTDVAADAYYAAAVQWAVAEGVTAGTSDTTFAPDAACTRGQIVTFLYRDMA